MAPQEDKQQVEENKKEFDKQQLAALETISNERPEVVVEAAERIGVLQKGVKQRIDDEFKGHVLQFQAALAKERSEGAPDKEAFLRAFKTIYGKFVLEQTDPEMEKPEGSFMKTMKRVLTPKAFAKMGESPAIKAAAARLSALSSDKAKADAERRIQEKEQEKATSEGQTSRLKHQSDVLNEVNKEFASKVNSFPKAFSGLSKDYKNKVISLSIFVDNIRHNLDSELIPALEELRDNNTINLEIPGLEDEIKDFLTKADKFKQKGSNDIAMDECEEFLNETYSPLTSEIQNLLEANASRCRKKYQDNQAQISTLEIEIQSLGSFSGTSIEKNRDNEVTDLKKQRDEKEPRFLAMTDDITELTIKKVEVDGKANEAQQNIAGLNQEKAEIPKNILKLEAEGLFFADSLNKLKPVKGSLNDVKSRLASANLSKIFKKLELVLIVVSNIKGQDKLPKEEQILCQGALDAYQREIQPLKSAFERGETIDRSLFTEYIENRLEIFFGELNTRLTALNESAYVKIGKFEDRSNEIDTEIQSHEADLVRLQQKAEDYYKEIQFFVDRRKEVGTEIDDLEAQIIKQQNIKPADRVLGKAFPVVDRVAKRKADRLKMKAVDDLKNADKAQNYLEQPGISTSIRAAYDSLSSYKTDVSLNSRFIAYAANDMYSTNIDTIIRNLRFGPTEEKRLGEDLKKINKNMKTLKSSMRDFVEYLPLLVQLKVVTPPPNAKRSVDQIVLDYKRITHKGYETTLEELEELTIDVLGYFDTIDFSRVEQQFADGVPKLEDALEVANAKFKELDDADKKQHLSGVQAPKQVIFTILKEQYPDKTDEELQHLATLILTDDIETIQTLDSYEKIAEKGNAKLHEAVRQAGLADMLVRMEYKEAGGEKINRPFQGVKPEILNDVDTVIKLLESGKMDLKKGFIVLAAYENLHEGTTNLQAVKLAKSLKLKLAKQLGAGKHMTNSEVNAEVEKAFQEMKEEGENIYNSYSTHYESSKYQWNSNMVSHLEKEYRILEEERKRGLKDDEYHTRKAELLDKAREGGVEKRISFGLDSAMTDYYPQFMSDFGHKLGQYSKTKGVGLAKIFGKLGLSFTGGVLGRGLNATKYALDKPYRYVAKYPFMLAAKAALFIPRNVFNFFSSKKWNAPFQGMKARREADGQKAAEYRKGIYTGIATNTKNAVINTTKSEWNAAKPEYQSYEQRSSFDIEAAKKESNEFKESSKSTVAEIPSLEAVDLGEYKTKIAELIKNEENVDNQRATG